MNAQYRKDEIQGQIVHEYDGIEEADNGLPHWWLWTFWLCILFAALYWTYYQSLAAGQGPLARYTDERLAAMDKGGPVTEQELVKLAADPAMVAAGSAAYAQLCVQCHLERGAGKIGPNLTDEYWIYGGAPLDIFNTILRGQTGKGMPEWGPVLGKGKVKQLTGFVLSMRNTHVPGKAPQGEKWPAATP